MKKAKKTAQQQTLIALQKAPIVTKRLLGEIRSLIDQSRSCVAQAVNSTLVILYWQIGRTIQQDDPFLIRRQMSPRQYERESAALLFRDWALRKIGEQKNKAASFSKGRLIRSSPFQSWGIGQDGEDLRSAEQKLQSFFNFGLGF